MLRTIVKQILYGLLRTVLATASGWLIAQGYMTEGQWEYVLAGLAGALITAALSVANKYHVREKIITALGLPEGSTSKDLKAAMKQEQPG